MNSMGVNSLEWMSERLCARYTVKNIHVASIFRDSHGYT